MQTDYWRSSVVKQLYCLRGLKEGEKKRVELHFFGEKLNLEYR